jgi:hypothetical protein
MHTVHITHPGGPGRLRIPPAAGNQTSVARSNETIISHLRDFRQPLAGLPLLAVRSQWTDKHSHR